MRSSVIIRIVTWLAAAAVGAFYGVAGTVAHSVMWGGEMPVFSDGVPIGLIVSIITCAALLIAIRALTHDRFVALAAGLGMLGALLLFSGAGPGGSVLVADSVYAWTWIWSVLVIATAVVVWPSPRPRAEKAGTPVSYGARTPAPYEPSGAEHGSRLEP